MTVDMSDIDEAMVRYEGALDKSKEIAKELLEQGKLSIAEISAVTHLPEKVIREL